ncbi:hypothetical protein Shyd_60800 [Streptomyces hydrogenans]|uniref:Secreted protein n=1 Tax=Streptomyces hydrogenans TaxID=1873719 RepID=A0ABQ3PI76_9ACTN|nr:hypothetical protein GCM10018784_73440 [Streptomyces hydrogenans]GHI24709.1 hypothetical protein Shyd_60800 [Streptomyces hydrogenans]
MLIAALLRAGGRRGAGSTRDIQVTVMAHDAARAYPRVARSRRSRPKVTVDVARIRDPVSRCDPVQSYSPKKLGFFQEHT